jgi:hypothetical protein
MQAKLSALHADRNVIYFLTAIAWLQALAAITSTMSKLMVILRTAAVLADFTGLIVSIASGNPAPLVRYTITLPINVIRLREMRRLVSRVKAASRSDLNVEWLKPFMYRCRYRKGDALFRKDDLADKAFILVEGEIVIPEIGARLAPGALLGEVALFTPERVRTASAICATDVHLLAITYEQFEQLYFQNPEFGLYLVRLIVLRLRAEPAPR